MFDRKYSVFVDDNYHYGDESERVSHGKFHKLDDAVAACRKITRDSLRSFYEPGIAAGELIAQWALFGDDPFVRGTDGSVPFSARQYVSEELCQQILAERIESRSRLG